MLGALSPRRQRSTGLTLPELLVGLIVVGVLAVLVTPNLTTFIRVQRLKSINAQLVTDLQFARSEAVARNQYARISFRSSTGTSGMTCYTIYTAAANDVRCNCLSGIGSACTGTAVEIRTVRYPRSDFVLVSPQGGLGQDTAFAYDHVAGGIVSIPSDDDDSPLDGYSVQTLIDSNRILRNRISRAGRISVCSAGTVNLGAPPC